MNAYTDCIIWDKRISKNGYGQVTRRRISSSPILAHRLAYCEAHGLEYHDIHGLHVRHKCDNRACVNPSHLELGTHKDNMRDMVERNRSAHMCGEDHNQSKLTATQINEIRRRYKPRDPVNGQYKLAAEFGVTQSLISMIVNKKVWKHFERCSTAPLTVVDYVPSTERGHGGFGSTGMR